MNLIDLSLKLNGFPINKAERKLKQIEGIQAEKYEEFINNQKLAIVNFHLKNNNFYREIVKLKTHNWESLPVLEKKDLQISLQQRLSDNFTLDRIFKNKTSGSSGNPFYFAKDKFSHALTWAVIKNRFNWHQLYGKKQARFYGIPQNGFDRKKELLKDFFSNRYRFDVFDVSHSAIERWLKKFESSKFVYLNGYTSVLVVFAKYLISQKKLLKDICPTLQACVVTSEMLFKSDRTILEKGFGVKVINEYGASELDLIAFEDADGNWILNTSTLYVEVLNDLNKPVKDGEIGDIVITSLFNKAHPFIRYKIGDRGAIKKVDSKKYLLEKLEGRNEDIIKLPSGKVSPGLTFYYITKSVMEDSGKIREIKVIQNRLDNFTIEYISDMKLTKSEEIKITDALIKYLEPDLDINFVKLEKLKRSKSGKLKQFTSLIK